MAEPFDKSLKFFMEHKYFISIRHNRNDSVFGRVLRIENGVVEIRQYDAVTKEQTDTLFCIALRDINFVTSSDC